VSHDTDPPRAAGESSPAAADWPSLLRRDLLPAVQSLRELADRFLTGAHDAPPDFRADADRLYRGAFDLLENTRFLTSQGATQQGADSAALVRRGRHALLNILDRVLGYSELLLDVEDMERFGAPRADLERIAGLSQQCKRLIDAYLAVGPGEPGEPGGPGPEEALAPEPLGRVLVVDDDAAHRRRLAAGLEGHGFVVEEASGGEEALRRLRRDAYDLMLLDLTLPGLDGFEVLRRMQADARLRSAPVIVVSAQDAGEHAARCLGAGAEDFLTKPIDQVLLRARINAVLLRRRLRVRELEQFFPPAVARQLIDRPDVLDEGTQTTVSVLFCDIRGYSRISRRLGPAESIKWVSAVMEELTECVSRNNGVVVDFIGDELMAMWGAPTLQPEHADLACHTALEMFACLPRLNAAWQERLGEAIDFGVGVNSGPAWVGNSGTRKKFKYGPSGDTVNVGSRVQGATKYLKAPLIVSRATYDQLRRLYDTRRLGRVRVVNIAEPVELFEVVPRGAPDWEERKRPYEEALALYEEGRLEEAARLLGSLVAAHGAAGPPLALLARTLEGLLQPERWAAVFELPGK
jgi:adenylate cyclase